VVFIKSNIQAIKEYILQQNSPATRKIYEAELSTFLKVIGNKKYRELLAKDMSKYQASMQEYSLKNGDKRKTSSSTRARKISIINGFLKFIFRRGYIKKDLSAEMVLPKVNQKPPDVLTEEEAQALIRVPDKRTYRGLRDYLILRIFLLTGCRLTELISINWGDFSKKYNFWTLLLKGKGDKQRIVKIPKDLEQEVQSYKGKVEKGATEPLFITTSKRGLKPTRITAIAIRHMLKKCANKALINKHITPHSLRHTCFSLEVANGANVFQVMEQAGHTSLNTTQRYVRLFNSMENNGVDFNPLSNINQTS
jgi:integrase/recombinase XerD